MLKTKEDLIEAIKAEIKIQKPDTKDFKPNQILDLNHLDVSRIDDFSYLFAGGDKQIINFYEFTFIKIAQWNTRNLKKIDFMFYYSSFRANISEFDIENINSVDKAFVGSRFRKDAVKQYWWYLSDDLINSMF